MGIPQKYLDYVGTTQKFSGPLFSYRKDKEINEPIEFNVLDVRWGSGVIMDFDTMKDTHPTIQFKLKNNSMKRAQWTKSFPVPEIKLSDDE